MSNPNSETIKEFLVSINFDAEDSGADKLSSSIESATIKANIFANVIIAVATEAIQLIIGVTTSLDNLYFASERTLEGVANIKATKAAMMDFGVSPAQTEKSLEAIAAYYRKYDKAGLPDLEKLGYVLDPRTGQFHYDAQVAAHHQVGMPTIQVEELIHRIGVDEYFGQAIHQKPLEVGKQIQEDLDKNKEFDLDPEQAAKESRKAVEAWNRLSNDVATAADSIAAKVTPFVTTYLKFLDDTLGWIRDEQKSASEDFWGWMGSVPGRYYEWLFSKFQMFHIDDYFSTMAEVLKDVVFYLGKILAWAVDFLSHLGLGAAPTPAPISPPLNAAPAGPNDPMANQFGNRPYGPTDAADASHPRPGPDTPMTTAKGYEGLRLYAPEAVAGGPASQGITDLARQLQANDPQFNEVHALNDTTHHTGLHARSKHLEGLAMDASMKDNDYEGARKRARDYLVGLGMIEGGYGTGDFWIEPGVGHLHVQFNSQRAADKYEAILEARRKGTSQAPAESGLSATRELKPPDTPIKGTTPFFGRNPSGRFSSWDLGQGLEPLAKGPFNWLFGSSAPPGPKRSSPWDDWKPGAFGVPTAPQGGILGGSSMDVNRVEMPQTTVINIDGSGDPATTASLVAQSQEHVASSAAQSLGHAVTP